MPTTWNPADLLNTTLSSGNLTATGTASQGGVRASDFKTTGKFYWELVFNATGSATDVGIALSTANLANVGSLGANAVLMIIPTGTIYVNGGSVVTLGGFPASGTIAMAVDFGAKLMWIRCITVAPGSNNPGSWNGTVSNDPATGVGGASFSSLSGNWYPIATFNRADVVTANFSGPTFQGPIPSGFLAFDPLPTAARATQVALEHWLMPNADAQATLLALEHWHSATGTGLQAVVTQVALEHWYSVAVPTTAQARAWILA